MQPRLQQVHLWAFELHTVPSQHVHVVIQLNHLHGQQGLSTGTVPQRGLLCERRLRVHSVYLQQLLQI